MQRALVSLLGVSPLWLVYGAMSLAIPFYVLSDARGRKASYRFFRQRIGYGRVRSALSVFRNMYAMGKVVVDRFAAYAGKSFQVISDNQDRYDALASRPGSFMLAGAHLGNFEMLGYMLKAARATKVLVYDGETQTVMQNRSKMFSRTQVEMVPVTADLSHIYILNNALSSGEIVALPADRPYGSRKVFRLPFFGADAAFPAGPFTLAAQRGIPVLAVFVLKESRKSYRVVLERLPDPPADAGPAIAAESLASSYAAVLERIARSHPEQWFNFYDFWA